MTMECWRVLAVDDVLKADGQMRETVGPGIPAGGQECPPCTYPHEKAAPFLGPPSQKRQVGKESGKAMQGADPSDGAAQKEMSN